MASYPLFSLFQIQPPALNLINSILHYSAQSQPSITMHFSRTTLAILLLATPILGQNPTNPQLPDCRSGCFRQICREYKEEDAKMCVCKDHKNDFISCLHATCLPDDLQSEYIQNEMKEHRVRLARASQLL